MIKDDKFMDEEIICMINDKEKEIQQEIDRKAIEAGINEGLAVVDDETIEFEHKDIFDGRAKICMPKYFKEISQEEMLLNYLEEIRPDIVFADSKMKRNIYFLSRDINENKADELAALMEQTMQGLYPTVIWLEDGTEEINGMELKFLEFVIEKSEIDIYNLMFFAALEGKGLICCIDCTVDEMDNWRLAAKGMMKSFKINLN